MNCHDAKTMLHDQIDGYLDAKELYLIKQHLLNCTNCRRLQQDLARTKQILKSLPRATVNPVLLDRIRQQRKQSKFQKPWYIASASVALAASLAIMTILLPIALNTSENNSGLPQATIVTGLKQPSNVNFLVTVKETVNNVTFSFSVPPEFELFGYHGKQQLSWRGKLKQGNNLLTIPVMAIKPSSGILIMKIEHKTDSKEYKVYVDAQEENVRRPDRNYNAYSYS